MKYDYPQQFWALLKALELEFDPFGELTDDQFCDMWLAIGDHLTMYGINEAYDGVNETGPIWLEG